MRLQFLMSLVAAVVAVNLVFAKDNDAVPPHGGVRLREGTRLFEVSGRFEAVGDRVNFVVADSGESVRILENLALQRISSVLKESQTSPQWTISGTITEYNSQNYLLLTKALQAVKSVPKEPAAASGIGTRPRVDYSDFQEKKPSPKNEEPSHGRRP